MSIDRLSKSQYSLLQTERAVVSATTGTLSNAGTTYTDVNGVTWAYYRWTSGSGTITMSTSGYAKVLVVGGGGGGGGNNGAYGGAAGSGAALEAFLYLPVGTYSVVVGAAGAGSTGTGTAGGYSSFNNKMLYAAPGRGSSGNADANPGNGLTWAVGGTDDSLTSSITGSSVTYANRGYGAQTNPAARSANTGDGGYGAQTAGGGAAGGSGVVILAVTL